MIEVEVRKNLLLEGLSENGVRILELWHPSDPTNIWYFETGDFRPANSESHFHTLRNCRNITHIIGTYKSRYTESINFVKSVMAAIEAEKKPLTQKQFSKDFIYIWH